MKKVITLVLAFVLCMSMGMVAFASPVDPGEVQSILPYSYGTDKDGNPVTAYASAMSEEVKEILKDEQKVKDILTDAGYILKNDEKVTVVGAGDLHLVSVGPFSTEYFEVPEGGVDLELRIFNVYADGTEDTNVTSLKDGDRLYILHQKADGTWEVLEATAVVKTDESGKKSVSVNAHFDSLSPVVIIKVMSDGEVVILENNNVLESGNPLGDNNVLGENRKVATIDPKTGAVTKIAQTSTVKRSPKTGA